ncbi:MAG: tetratricopeptide repeat protein [Planctomycetes bacterium]|nr:tetratricopeptide repeat protein [Planctomycetota bacterium]
MTSARCSAAAVILATCCLAMVFRHGQAADAPKESAGDGDRIRAVWKIFNQAIATAPLQEEMPLERFLQVLAAQLPRDAKVGLSIDKEAFGKDYAALAGTLVQLQPFPKRMQPWTALRLALSRCPREIPAAIRIEPAGVVITTPERALFTLTYDVADLLTADARPWDASKLKLLGESVGLDGTPKLGKSTELIRLILGSVDPESWDSSEKSSLRIVNGTRLVVHARVERHLEIAGLLDGLRHRAGPVIMNARVVEVERLCYAQHIRPLLVDPRGLARTVTRIDKALEEALDRHKLVAKGNDGKLADGMEHTLVARFDAFSYAAELPQAGKEEAAASRRAVLDGFSIRAHVAVSPTGWETRLKLTQRIAKLLEMKKTAALDPATGKLGMVDAPHIREATLTGTIEVEDGAALLMPVIYPPPTKDRVWVFVARPTIFVEEEDAKSKTASKAPKQEPPAKEAPKPKPASTKGKTPPANLDVWRDEMAAGRKTLDRHLFNEAERHLAKALTEAERLPPRDARLPETVLALAELSFKQGRFGQADRHYLRAEALVEDIHDDQHPTVARCLNARAEIYFALGFSDDAVKLAQKALAMREKRLGKNHLDVVESLETLAAMGQSARALKDHALPIREKAQGEDHPGLIRCLLIIGRRDDGFKHLERALAIARKSRGEKHPDVAECLTAQSEHYLAAERYVQAIETQTAAMRIWAATLGPAHPRRGAGFRNLALAAQGQKRLDDADKHFREALICHFNGLTDQELCRYLPAMLAYRNFDGPLPLHGPESYLLEMYRRGGKSIGTFLKAHDDDVVERWRSKPAQAYAQPGNLEILTTLRRIQGKADPLQIVTSNRLECIFPNLPEVEVALTNLDPEKKPLIFQEGGDSRSGRQARWRFEIRDSQGKLVAQSEPRWGEGGGISRRAMLEHEQSWNTTLAMKSFVSLEPGEYTMRILYHDHETIADLDSTVGLIACRSEPIRLNVQPRVITLARGDRDAVKQLVSKLDDTSRIKVLAGTYAKGAHDFIAPASPQGRLLALGWKAVPSLLDALNDDKLSPGRRGWILALLFSITGYNDPRLEGVLGSYDVRQAWWQVWGGRDGRRDSGGFGGSADGSRNGVIDPAVQRDFARSWQRFRDFLIVRER